MGAFQPIKVPKALPLDLLHYHTFKSTKRPDPPPPSRCPPACCLCAGSRIIKNDIGGLFCVPPALARLKLIETIRALWLESFPHRTCEATIPAALERPQP